MQSGDQDGLAGPGRNLDAQPLGEGPEVRDGQGVEVLGDTEWTVTRCDRCNGWDDLGWLLMVRNEADLYIGPSRSILIDVVDEHIHRILSGHAACGGGPAMPERPRR